MKISEYQSGAGLNPTPVDPKVAAQGGGMLIDLGEGLSSLGEKFQQVQDDTQKSKAEVDLYKRFNDINNQAATDPEIWNHPERVDDMLKKAVDESSRGISSGQARQEYQQKASVEMSRRGVATHNLIRSKQLSERKTSLLNANDMRMEEYWNAANEGDRAAIKGEITNSVNDAIRKGVINADAGRQYLKTHLDKLSEGQVNKDLSIDAKATLSELQKGKDGIYKDLNPTQRTKAITSAENMVQKQKKQGKELHMIAQNKAEADLTGRYYQGGLTTDDVIKAQVSGRISPEFAKSVIKSIESPEAINHNTDTIAYMKLVDDMHDPKSDPKELRQRLLDLTAQGKLSNTVANHLYTANMLVNEEGDKTNIASSLAQGKIDARQKAIEDDQRQKDALKKQQSWWKSSVDYIKSWGKSTGKDQKEVASTTQDLFAKANESKTKPSESLDVVKGIINQKNIQANPRLVKNCPKDGSVCMDAQGNKARVYPDGHHEDI